MKAIDPTSGVTNSEVAVFIYRLRFPLAGAQVGGSPPSAKPIGASALSDKVTAPVQEVRPQSITHVE